LEVVLEVFGEIFADMGALQRHISKIQWFGPQQNRAVMHAKKLYVLGLADDDVRRYEFATAVKLLSYITEAKRLVATRSVILLHRNSDK